IEETPRLRSQALHQQVSCAHTHIAGNPFAEKPPFSHKFLLMKRSDRIVKTNADQFSPFSLSLVENKRTFSQEEDQEKAERISQAR
ncbi:hypothetical protein, partial [Faecalispora jeddahensis]|uniref:hypothetical protein n=1 Tax=Faecalispora jeddahensis TaxID=1414721 RepID=UPI0005AA91DE